MMGDAVITTQALQRSSEGHPQTVRNNTVRPGKPGKGQNNLADYML